MTNEELIRRGKKLLDGSYGNELFSSFGKMYPMTSENIKGTYELFDLKDKDVLSVISSGDHIFSAILNGAKSVTGFDVNYLTEYYYHFKKAMIETYDLDKFKEVLLYNIIPIGRIKEKWYEEFRDTIDDKYRIFWDEIVKYSLNKELPLDSLILACPNYFNLIDYLSEEKYNKLKENLGYVKTDFIHSDLLHLDKHLERKYDFMFFSNISDYIGINKTKELSKIKLMGNLKENGTIVYAYMYNAERKVVRRFEKDNAYPITSAYYDNDLKDYVLVMRKKNEWNFR